jgi:hypothetical protein
MLTLNQSPEILKVLSDVLRMLCRGLPQYLIDAKPWLRQDDAPFLAALRHLIADQRHYARLTAEAVTFRGGRPDPGTFPLEYASINDLSLVFLRTKILEQLRADYLTLIDASKQLADQHELNSLVEEIVGNYRGHLEVLEETE